MWYFISVGGADSLAKLKTAETQEIFFNERPFNHALQKLYNYNFSPQGAALPAGVGRAVESRGGGVIFLYDTT